MTFNVLTGIEDLNKSFPFRDAADPGKVAGEVTLRHLLYNYIFLPDGHSLFVESHHCSNIADVEVIVPNTPESNGMIEEMNKTSQQSFSQRFLRVLWTRSYVSR
jgi:hypothetical protein